MPSGRRARPLQPPWLTPRRRNAVGQRAGRPGARGPRPPGAACGLGEPGRQADVAVLPVEDRRTPRVRGGSAAGAGPEGGRAPGDRASALTLPMQGAQVLTDGGSVHIRAQGLDQLGQVSGVVGADRHRVSTRQVERRTECCLHAGQAIVGRSEDRARVASRLLLAHAGMTRRSPSEALSGLPGSWEVLQNSEWPS